MKYRVTLQNYKEDKYYPKVVRAIGEILQETRTFQVTDVLLNMGQLSEENLKRWKSGQVPYLEAVIQCNLGKADRINRIVSFHAFDLNLASSQDVVKHKGKILRYTKSRIIKAEKRYARRYRVIGKTNPFAKTP